MKLKKILCHFASQLRKIVRPHPLIDKWWYLKIAHQQFFTKKIKVGFGPITSGENDLAERKWRIDPIIHAINEMETNYSAGFFIDAGEMKNFDIVIIVKKFNPDFIPIIVDLKKKNKRFIYDIVDNPNSEEKYRFYFGDHPQFCELMDGFILSSPLHKPIANRFSQKNLLIEHPIIHNLYLKEYLEKEPISILAHGYYANLTHLIAIEPIIRDVAQITGKKIILTYHSEEVFPDTEWVKYIKWTKENCFQEFLKADIAISIKDLNNPHQKTKPSTKVISFMAAGLPFICTPTEADRLVIEEGVTGLFAFSADDWKKHLTTLVSSVAERKKMGRAARESVLPHYSIEAITHKYLKLLNCVMEEKRR